MTALASALLLFAPLPALRPVDETGLAAVLKEHRGKVVLVNFWATWCDPCRAEMPHLAALEKKLRGSGFVVLTVSADEPEQEAAARLFLQKSGMPGPAYIKRARNDEDFINSIDRKWSGALPALFLYDRQGNRAASFIGETEPAQVEAAARKLCAVPHNRE